MKEWFEENIKGPIREIQKDYGKERSSHWRNCRKKHLHFNPFCAICRKKKALNVHHIVPFSVDPMKELDSDNLITLCRKHHLIFGHLGWWKSWNENIVEDACKWQVKYLRRPRRKK